MLEVVLENIFEVLDLMLKHILSRCLKKCFMLQALKSVLEPNPVVLTAHTDCCIRKQPHKECFPVVVLLYDM